MSMFDSEMGTPATVELEVTPTGMGSQRLLLNGVEITDLVNSLRITALPGELTHVKMGIFPQKGVKITDQQAQVEVTVNGWLVDQCRALATMLARAQSDASVSLPNFYSVVDQVAGALGILGNIQNKQMLAAFMEGTFERLERIVGRATDTESPVPTGGTDDVSGSGGADQGDVPAPDQRSGRIVAGDDDMEAPSSDPGTGESSSGIE